MGLLGKLSLTLLLVGMLSVFFAALLIDADRRAVRKLSRLLFITGMCTLSLALLGGVVGTLITVWSI